MTEQHILRVVISDATTSPSRQHGSNQELWNRIDNLRAHQDPVLDIRVAPNTTDESVAQKDGDLESLLILLSVATFAVRPVLRFIVDLTRAIGEQRRCRRRIKTRLGQIDIEAEVEGQPGDANIDEIQSLVHHAISQCLESQQATPRQLPQGDADIEIILLDNEGGDNDL